MLLIVLHRRDIPIGVSLYSRLAKVKRGTEVERSEGMFCRANYVLFEDPSTYQDEDNLKKKKECSFSNSEHFFKIQVPLFNLKSTISPKLKSPIT